MKLNISERLSLSQLCFPEHSGKIEMILIDSIIRKVEITADEITEFGISEKDGVISWKTGKEVEFEFTPEQVDVLKQASKRTDEQKKVTRNILSLIQKIDNA